MSAGPSTSSGAGTGTGTGSDRTTENQVVMPGGAGGDEYQTVTIVPSEGNAGGEVSYVLIVQQPEDKDGAPVQKRVPGAAGGDMANDGDMEGKFWEHLVP